MQDMHLLLLLLFCMYVYICMHHVGMYGFACYMYVCALEVGSTVRHGKASAKKTVIGVIQSFYDDEDVVADS